MLSIKTSKINNLLRSWVFHDTGSGTWKKSSFMPYCAWMPEKEYYYMLFSYADIILIIMIYLKLFKKI